MDTGLFSNHHRWRKVAAAVLLLFALCGWSYWAGPQQHFYAVDCLKQPTACAGKSVLAAVAKIQMLQADGFLIETQGREFFVRGRAAGLEPGKYIDVKGVFRASGELELETYHLHRERQIKLMVSIIPLVILTYLVRRDFMVNSSRKMF